MRDDIKKLQAKLAAILTNLPEGVNVGIALEDLRGNAELFTFVSCDASTAGYLFEAAGRYCSDLGFEDFLTEMSTPERLH